jgi:DNA polymerase-3 subunit gamma/tau
MLLDDTRPAIYPASVSYRVFARKYRPQTFAEVVGQEHITRTLQNSVTSGRLAQAWLFVGPRGIGKTSTARILAKALNCSAGPTPEPCGTCDACLEIAEGRSLDVIEIDGASNNGVDHIRDIRDSAAYAPARGKFKIYLIDEVHMLTTGAFNALLKTLEEPPPHVKFIFATTEAQKVPATITSRCQRFDLRRIPADSIQKHLLYIASREAIVLDADAAAAIARGADGGLRDAESMLDQMVAFCGDRIARADVMDVFGFTPLEVVQGLAGSILAGDARKSLDTVAAQSEAGKDLTRLVAELVVHLRDLVVEQATGGASVVPQAKLLDLLDHFGAVESALRWVTDKKLHLDVAIIKALHILDETSLTDVIHTLTGLCQGDPPKPRPLHATPDAPLQRPAPAPTGATPVPIGKTGDSQPAGNAGPEPRHELPAAAWERICRELDAVSDMRFGWLQEGRFEAQEGSKFKVRFPEACRDMRDSLLGDRDLRDLESRLTAAVGKPLKMDFVFDASLERPPEAAPAPVEEPTEPESPAPAQEAPPAPAPPTDPNQDFLNDPLIEKALEIFQGTLQTANS